MESHVKERIVGAAILVALGVWLIPWVLDGPDDASVATEAGSDEILPAAAESGPLRTETVELDPAPSASERVARAPNAEDRIEPGRAQETGIADTPVARDDGGTDSAAAPAGDAAASGGRVATATNAGDGAESPAEQVGRSEQPGQTERPGRSEQPAPTPTSPPAAAAAPRRDGWAVQLGAFGDVSNADQLASRVSTYGYSAYVSEFRSGGDTMHRVRVGGFDTENEAEAAASSLSAHGFPGRVISPE